MGKKDFSDSELEAMSPKEFRDLTRRGEWTEGNLQACRGYAQADVAIIPKEYMSDFLLFCFRNSRPCPLIDVTDVGSLHPMRVAPEADLRTDLSRYRVFINGELVAEPTDIEDYWRDDLVGFVTGCSRTFDWAFDAANVSRRFIGVYTSNISLTPAGPFGGNMVVTCRLIKGAQNVVRAIQISSRYVAAHGAPIHIGDPALIGINDLYHPDILAFPEPIAPQEPDEVALFWGCGITLQIAAMEAKPSLWIVDGRDNTFVTDRLSEELAVI